MKTKRFAALALAALLMAALLSGCTIKAPATVGSVGGVEIPAGVYLILQYDAYGQAAGMTIEKDVLKATLTVGEEEIKGLDYIQRETLNAVERYAAVEAKFEELGGSLTEAELYYAQSYANSLWQGSQEVFAANGIGLASLQLWIENSLKAADLLGLLYGAEGTQPVSDAELTAFVNANFVRAEYVAVPLVNYSTFTFLDEEGDAENSRIAQLIKAGLEAGDTTSELAIKYLPDAYALLDQTFDPANASSAVGTLMAPASQLEQYGEEAKNTLLAAKPGQAVVVDVGMSRLVCLVGEVLDGTTTLDDLRVSALSEMKQEELDAALAAEGAAMAHALDQSAMNRYSPKNIKD